MGRYTLLLTVCLLGAASVLGLGCSNGSTSILTGSVASPAPAFPTASTPGEPLARSARVASTAARAQICGVPFDAAKLKASYLAYEAKQGADRGQLSAVEKSYDTTLSSVATQRAAVAVRCSALDATWTRDRNVELSNKYKEELQAELARYTAGLFAPSQKAPEADGPLNSKTFWKEQDDG